MASDLKFIRQAIKGNKNAFGKLVELYQDNILFLVYDYLGNYEEAEDAAQDVFVKAFENLKSFNLKAEFKTWLYRIAINTSIDYLRKKKSMIDSQNKIQSEFSGVINNKPGIDIWDDIFDNAINNLSENQYSAIVLKYFHDKSTKEISEILECDINSIRVHLHRGIHKLKHTYKKSEE